MLQVIIGTGHLGHENHIPGHQGGPQSTPDTLHCTELHSQCSYTTGRQNCTSCDFTVNTELLKCIVCHVKPYPTFSQVRQPIPPNFSTFKSWQPPKKDVELGNFVVKIHLASLELRLFVFHELLSLGCINFKSLCAHHEEEVLRIPKHPQLAKFG